MIKTNANQPPFALFIRGSQDEIFDLSDELGFESSLAGMPEALAISIFEDGPESLHIQALYVQKDSAQAALALLKLSETQESFITQLDDVDWVSRTQAGLPPVQAGRFWVYGDHDKDKVKPEFDYPICINAGMAFGTGHHGTTKGCLLIFNGLIDEGFKPHKILDLGTGAGTLAIAAAKHYQQPIIATDIDPDAVDVSTANAKLNGVAPHIHAVVADGFEHSKLKGQKFDLIFANILAVALIAMSKDIAGAMQEDGYVILSGILTPQVKDVQSAFEAAGIKTYAQPPIGEWTSLIGQLLPA